MRVDQAKRLEDACVRQELQKASARLKKLVAEHALDLAILRDAASGHF